MDKKLSSQIIVNVHICLIEYFPEVKLFICYNGNYNSQTSEKLISK